MAYSLEMVERLGLFINTLIISTTDHGHLFGEHSLQGKPGPELGRLYEATTRVPLLVRQSRGLGAGQHIKGIVQPPAFFPPFWSSSPRCCGNRGEILDIGCANGVFPECLIQWAAQRGIELTAQGPDRGAQLIEPVRQRLLQ